MISNTNHAVMSVLEEFKASVAGVKWNLFQFLIMMSELCRGDSRMHVHMRGQDDSFLLSFFFRGVTTEEIRVPNFWLMLR